MTLTAFSLILIKNNLCSNNVSSIFQSIENVKDNCIHFCPLECNRTLFKTSISSSMLVGDYWKQKILEKPNLKMDFVNRSIDSESSRNSFVYMYIFYDSLSYTMTSEKEDSTSIISLAASIGGILSLFLGISVLSLFEIVEAFIQFYISSK